MSASEFGNPDMMFVIGVIVGFGSGIIMFALLMSASKED